MSRTIDPELQQIMEARYGEEVRGSIVSALEKTYDTCSDIDDTVVATTKVWSSKKTSDEIAKGSDEIIVSPSTPSSQYNKLWIKDQAEIEYTVPTYQEFGDLKSALDAASYYDDFVTSIVLCGNGFLYNTGLYGFSSNWKLFSVDVSEVSKIDIRSYIRQISSSSEPKMLWCFYDVIPTELNYTSLTADNVVQKGEVLSALTAQEIERTVLDVPIGAKGMLVMIGTGYATLAEPQVKGYKSVIKVIDKNEIFSDTRNLFYVTDTTNRTSHNVQITFNDDGSFTLNGTSNAVTEIPIMGGIASSDTNIEAGTYTYHIFCEPEYDGLAVGMRSGATGSSNIPPDVPFTLSSPTNIFVRIGTGKVYNNNKIWIEFEKGNTTGVYVKHTDKNKADIQARADIKELTESISNLTIISDLKKRSYKPHMKYVSWRGLHLTVPENSIPSYELAGKSCFDVLNIARIRASADKTLWVMHNSTVDATTDGTGSVFSLTDTYLSSLHLLYDGVATEYGIPTAEEAIQVCLKYGMIPMLRCYGFSSDTSAAEWQNLFSLIDGYGIADRFMFSGSADDIQRMINLYPNGIYVWHDDTEAMTTAQMIALMNGFTGIGKDHLCAMLRDDATLADAKAMHSAGYMIYDDHCRDITAELALKERLANITAWGYDYANFYLIPPDTLNY